MTETTAEPPASAGAAEAGSVPATTEAAPELTIRSLLEAGVHFGHQTARWNPRMRDYLFGQRHGIHIIDLDQSLPHFREALDFIRDTVAGGGRALFVSTKRQAAPTVRIEALRCNQFYVNNRWLGGMLTNWKTVKKSIDRYKNLVAIRADEEKQAEFSKKELARVVRQCDKYAKSLEGIKEMSRLPDVMFVIDVLREQIAVSEAQRLGIPIVAVVDSNCNPDGIDFVIPGNDDSMRAIGLYCGLVAETCLEGGALHEERLRTEGASEGASGAPASGTGRRVVEIRQQPRRGRGRERGGRGQTGRSFGHGDEREAPSVATVEVTPAVKVVAPKAAAPPAEESKTEA